MSSASPTSIVVTTPTFGEFRSAASCDSRSTGHVPWIGASGRCFMNDARLTTPKGMSGCSNAARQLRITSGKSVA